MKGRHLLQLPRLDDQNKSELSLIEVAHEILSETNEIHEFSALLERIQEYLGLSTEEIEARMVDFYTELNTDGSFISLGDNRWGLRSWYPVDAINEEIVSELDDDEFVADHEVHHSDNDSFFEDEDEYDEEHEDEDDYEGGRDDEIDRESDSDEDDEDDELRSYRRDLEELGEDGDDIDDDDLEDGLEGDLTVIDEDDEDDE